MGKKRRAETKRHGDTSAALAVRYGHNTGGIITDMYTRSMGVSVCPVRLVYALGVIMVGWMGCGWIRNGIII